MSPLDVTDLIRIAAVANHGGFTRAASALGMTQPALTRTIAAAERLVGGQLFVRRRPRAEPTALCRMILADAPEIIARMQDLHHRLLQVRGGSGEELRLASGPFPLETAVLPAAAAFRTTHPRVRLRVETLPWPDALAQLRARRFDLAILTAGADIQGSDLVSVPLAAQRLLFAVRRGHPLTKIARPSLPRILAYPLATTAQVLPSLQRALAQARGEDSSGPRADIPFPAITVESAAAWLTVVGRSDCIALTTPAAARPYVASGQIALLPVRRPWLSTRHAVVHLASEPLSASAADFVRALERANAEALELSASAR
jgi:DNA-binding transcriptional LysR family regulator